jgi:predicted PurR-regulated permease PerM
MDQLNGILLALTIVVGLGVLIFIVVLLVLAKTLLHTRKRVHDLLDHYQTTIAPHIGPIVQSTRSLVDDLSPKLKHITTNMVDVSDILRTEQAARVDDIVSSTLNGIGHATAAVQEGLSTPIRHLNGILDGLRAGIGSFRRKRPHSNGTGAATIVRKVEQDPY